MCIAIMNGFSLVRVHRTTSIICVCYMYLHGVIVYGWRCPIIICTCEKWGDFDSGATMFFPRLVSGGYVQLRNWAVAGPEHGPRRPAKRRSAEDAKRLVKTKPCWFYHHHPQGCPRLSLAGGEDSCPYAHGCRDLRKRPNFSSTDDPVVPFPSLTN